MKAPQPLTTDAKVCCSASYDDARITGPTRAKRGTTGSFRTRGRWRKLRLLAKACLGGNMFNDQVNKLWMLKLMKSLARHHFDTTWQNYTKLYVEFFKPFLSDKLQSDSLHVSCFNEAHTEEVGSMEMFQQSREDAAAIITSWPRLKGQKTVVYQENGPRQGTHQEIAKTFLVMGSVDKLAAPAEPNQKRRQPSSLEDVTQLCPCFPPKTPPGLKATAKAASKDMDRPRPDLQCTTTWHLMTSPSLATIWMESAVNLCARKWLNESATEIPVTFLSPGGS